MDTQPFLGIVIVSDEPLATPPYRFVRIGPRSDAAIRDWESRSNRKWGSDAVVRLIWVVLLPLSSRIESGLALLRKEVIQPHLPVQLPCYDLVPVIGSTLGTCLP